MTLTHGWSDKLLKHSKPFFEASKATIKQCKFGWASRLMELASGVSNLVVLKYYFKE